MNTLKLNRICLSVLMLLLLTFFSGSCKKTNMLALDQGKADIAAAAAKNSANALPHTKRYPADVATEWYTLLTRIVRTKPYANPQALRIYAYSGVALYEAVVPGMPSYQSIYKYLTLELQIPKLLKAIFFQ